MANYFQFCKPNCEKRKPGCQDRCDFYAERRKLWDERKAILNADKEARQYTTDQKAKNFDTTVKNKKGFAGHNWRRYGR